MKFWLTVENFGTIEDVQDRRDLALITHDLSVERLKEYLGNHEDIEDFNGFFGMVKDGDYQELYGFNGSVPDLHKPLYKILWGLKEEIKTETFEVTITLPDYMNARDYLYEAITTGHDLMLYKDVEITMADIIEELKEGI